MKSFAYRAATALPLLLAMATPVWAQGNALQTGAASPAAPIAVQNAWARASAGANGTSAAYLTVVDHGPADRLLSASTPVASKVELHETKMDGTVMRMLPVAGIDVAPGKPAELKPGGLHIMLMGLTQPLRAGESFPLTLTFAHAPPVTVTVPVVPPGGSAPHSH